jgi:acyl-CoA synthetase (AMP-forming)/AMP-acid ligase II
MKLFTNPILKKINLLNDAHIIIEENGHSYTVKELKDLSTKYAIALKKDGIQEGDKTLLLLKSDFEFLKIFYALLKLNTVIVIIDPEMGKENFNAKIAQLNPKYIFIDSGLLFLLEHPIIRLIYSKIANKNYNIKINNGANIYAVGNYYLHYRQYFKIKKIKDNTEQIEWVEANIDSDFLITYTSGTLSKPKGVVHTIRSITESLRSLETILDTTRDKKLVSHLPQYILLGANANIPILVWNNEWSSKKKIDFIAHHKITTVFGPPSDLFPIVQYCESQNIKLPPCLKSIYLGSAPVHASFLKRLYAVAIDIRITCMYGMTEILLISTIDGRDKINYIGEGDIVGKINSNISMQLDSDGELCFNSPQKFKGYFNLSQSEDYHKSGDIGQIDENGNLVLHGRKKDMMIRGNFNIYPGLYEPTINKIEGIIDCAMIGIYSELNHDQKIILCIETEADLSEKEIMNKLKTGPYSIDTYALPDQIIFMRLPRSGRSNKINKAILSEKVIR